MEEKEWKYCAVGNVVKTHLDKDGVVRYGTLQFTGGTKVYLYGKFWHKSEEIAVLGLSRGKRYIVQYDVPIDYIENVRLQRTYHPKVLEIMNNFEFWDGWWGNTQEDREDVLRFIKAWKAVKEIREPGKGGMKRKKLSREMMHRLMESDKVEYNPVVFYGSETACSLIADEIEGAQRKKFPNRDIYRTDPNQFYSDMVVSVIIGSRTEDEANEVRKADMMIFENVHLLSRRPESEERFYFLFDSFYESGKQIIITSGCAPSEIDGLDNRIRTQLEGGLMINVRYE